MNQENSNSLFSDHSSNPSIEKALETAIVASRKKKEMPEGGFESFWFSNLGHCPRKQIAQRMGIPPDVPIPMSSQFKMWTGTCLHKTIQEQLESVGYLDPEWTEKHVTYRTYSGHTDGLTHHVLDGAIVEIKTSDDSAVKKKDMPSSYLWQGIGLCMATKKSNLLVFQFGKNQGLSRNQVYSLKDDGTNDIPGRKQIDTHIGFVETLWKEYKESGVLPDHSHMFPWESRWCPYK